MLSGQTAHEALHISRKKSLSATINITSNISNAENRQEKNEIFAEFVGGTLSSAGAGIALRIIFATTLVGWVAALAIGSATVVAGWAGGKSLKEVYDSQFDKYDFVKMSGIDRWCN